MIDDAWIHDSPEGRTTDRGASVVVRKIAHKDERKKPTASNQGPKTCHFARMWSPKCWMACLNTFRNSVMGKHAFKLFLSPQCPQSLAYGRTGILCSARQKILSVRERKIDKRSPRRSSQQMAERPVHTSSMCYGGSNQSARTKSRVQG